ncbi:MAG: hypothetical protein ACR2O0_11065 [Rhizobiaceae bacterium]
MFRLRVVPRLASSIKIACRIYSTALSGLETDMKFFKWASMVSVLSFTAALPAFAGGADVISVRVTQSSDGKYDFSVTVKHDDEGWDHYANSWQVVGADGTVFGERVLLHPHENEQPFTRSQSGIVIPDGITEVIIRAGDSQHGFSGVEKSIELPGR